MNCEQILIMLLGGAWVIVLAVSIGSYCLDYFMVFSSRYFHYVAKLGSFFFWILFYGAIFSGLSRWINTDRYLQLSESLQIPNLNGSTKKNRELWKERSRKGLLVYGIMVGMWLLQLTLFHNHFISTVFLLFVSVTFCWILYPMRNSIILVYAFGGMTISLWLIDFIAF